MSHFSASQVNTFLDEPALWLLKEFRGYRSEAGPGAWRGSAIEQAMDVLVYNREAPDEELMARVMDRFEDDAQGDLSDDTDREREKIKAYMDNLVPWARKLDWPKPDATQIKKEHWIDGVDDPLLMYLDYSWPDVVRDLKTTGRAPSFDKDTGYIKNPSHVRQMAIYSKATGKPVELIYVTPTKDREPIIYRLSEEEIEIGMSEVRAALMAMQRLRRSGDFTRIAELFPPRDVTSFRWDDAARQQAKTIWFNAA